jgi:hypothetical protein
MRQHDLALQHLEPGQALRRHRQAGLAAGRQRQAVEQNASSRHPRIGKQVLAGSPAFRRFGGCPSVPIVTKTLKSLYLLHFRHIAIPDYALL